MGLTVLEMADATGSTVGDIMDLSHEEFLVTQQMVAERSRREQSAMRSGGKR